METQTNETVELEMTENDVYRERTADVWSVVARPHARGLWRKIATGDDRATGACVNEVLGTIDRIREVRKQISQFADPASFPEQRVTMAGREFVIPRMPDDERESYLAQLRPELARLIKSRDGYLAGRW